MKGRIKMLDLKIRNVRFGAGKPKICVPLIGQTFDEIMEQATQAKKVADVIEWRADFYQDVLDDEQLLMTLMALRDEVRQLPVIFNLKTETAGGNLAIPLREYRRIYEFVVTSKQVDLMDVDLELLDQLGPTFVRWIQALNLHVIVSDYYNETPKDAILLFRLNVMEHLGADIGKLVVKPLDELEVLRLLETTVKAQSFVSLPVVALAKGNLGRISQVAGSLTGSAITYGCLPDLPAEEGQLPAVELRQMIKLL